MMVCFKWKILCWLYKKGFWKPKNIKHINPFTIDSNAIHGFGENLENGDLVFLKCDSGLERVFEIYNHNGYQSFGHPCYSANIRITPFYLTPKDSQ